MTREAGFIDAHVHIKNYDSLSDIARAGVSVVRDAGLRENAERNIVPNGLSRNGVRVVSAGWALYKNGGYGRLLGLPVETMYDMRREILRLKTSGAAIIKVVASGMVSLKHPGQVTQGGFTKKELGVIVDDAYDAGLGVMAHANGEEAIMNAASARVESIEHGFFMTERALEFMARWNVLWVPTVTALARAVEAAGPSKEVREFVQAQLSKHMVMIRKAHDMGVRLAIGTDAVLPDPEYRGHYQSEMSYFEMAGIPHAEVYAIARGAGAGSLGILNQRSYESW